MDEDDLRARSITLEDDDGRRTVITAGAITVDGGPGRGLISAEFASDGAALFVLCAPDGNASAKIRAALDGTGVTVETPKTSSTLVARGLSVIGEEKKVAMTEEGIIVKSVIDGRRLWLLTFAPLDDAKRFFGGLKAGLLGLFQAAE